MTEPLRFIHISDTHINPDPDYIKSYAQYTPKIGAKALVKAINDLPFTPDFILHTGDVAYDPDPDVYPYTKELFSAFDVPLHYLVGNHDDGRDLQRVLLGRAEDEIQDYYYYEFEAKGVQFVCLDSNGEHDPKRPSGTVTPEQLDWLEGICTSDDPRPLVIAIHHNVIPMGVPWLDDWMRLENGETVHDIIKQASHRLRGVFFGHIHQNIETYQDGVLYIAAASSWCQFISYPMPENERVAAAPNDPPGFTVVTITLERTYLRRHTFMVVDTDL